MAGKEETERINRERLEMDLEKWLEPAEQLSFFPPQQQQH